MSNGLFRGDDGKLRCWWCSATPTYQDYHDHEWGYPVHDDRRLFEKICLEGFQSGLSWLTILNKREAFRAAFCDFDIYKVSQFGEHEVNQMLVNQGIVRHRGKIEATINNAKRALEMVTEYGSLSDFFWRYQPAKRERHLTRSDLANMATSPESIALSKDLKRRGWKFVGPTTVYAFMQAMGLVNDHLEGCWTHESE
ncbi:MAG: DNA-3-methyladenine glycosylase I [Acidobacteria bacterium]|nr:DNA-3-methyladenine glycosylase I [Acidobacteriota bacterium]